MAEAAEARNVAKAQRGSSYWAAASPVSTRPWTWRSCRSMSRSWIERIITSSSLCSIRSPSQCCLRPISRSRSARSCATIPNIDVLMDEAVGFDLPEQRVHLKTGVELEYDYLIIATGSTHSYFGRDDWAKLAPGLKTIEDATEIRRRVLLAFELAERQMMESGTHPPLNFVIIGGGPTGVELAGAISDIAKLYMSKDFRHIDPSMAQVLILEGSPNILGAVPAGPAAQGGRTAQRARREVPHQRSCQRRAAGLRHGRRRTHRRCRHALGGRGAGFAAGQAARGRDRQARLRLGRQPSQPTGSSGDLHLRRPCARRGERQAGSRRCATRDADGPLRREAHRPADCREPRQRWQRQGRAVSLLRQGRHGHDRPQGRRRQHPMALQRPLERLSGVDDLARRPHLLSHRLPQPPLRLSSVGLDVPYLQRWRAPDYGLAGVAGME